MTTTHGENFCRRYWCRKRSISYSAFKTNWWASSIRNLRDDERSLRKRYLGVIILKKDKDAVRGFGSHSRRDHTDFTFDWRMNLNKEVDNAQVHLLRIWNRNGFQHSIYLEATVDPALMIDFAEPYQMMPTLESL